MPFQVLLILVIALLAAKSNDARSPLYCGFDNEAPITLVRV